ncbi:MAG TPA: homoserine dehydrogenase [Pirellulales bacterium]|jgi:homoserine dehydrogenase|nr:homoserine dehydrogenase [Pirellulales bacterium]
MEKTKVAIVGLGTVGSGVAKILLANSERTARHAGRRRLWLEQVVVRDVRKPRDVTLPAGVLSEDLQRILKDPEIVAVAHLVGGLEPARTILLQLLESGKDVITANKALLAEHGPELFDRARALGRTIAFEAAVAGGIPIIANIGQCLSANQILSLHGILNGTSNFILSAMENEGKDYSAAVAEAQRLGYAEADPTLDVDGSDAAQKLAILAHLAFGTRVHWSEISRRGIDDLDPVELHFAKELGYRIKLLAVAQLAESGLEMHVSPTMVKIGSPLGEVHDAYNAVSVVGDAVGRIFFHGLGAGQMPTASAVVADMIDTIVGRTAITFRTLEPWTNLEIAPRPVAHGASQGRYYLRFRVADRPGVLADIAGSLGRQGISIASVIQHETQDGSEGTVPLVIMTHSSSEGAIEQALREIHTLQAVGGKCVKLRVRN